MDAGSRPATLRPNFDDSNRDAFNDASNPLEGVRTAGAGVKVTVTEQNTGGTMKILVNYPG